MTVNAQTKNAQQAQEKRALRAARRRFLVGAAVGVFLFAFMMGLYGGYFAACAALGVQTRELPPEEEKPATIEIKAVTAEAEEEVKQPEVETIVENEDFLEIESLGMFRITAYCPCVKCCNKDDGITATGTKATQGRTIAVDPAVIPYGTTVYIDGHAYVAEDCGGAIDGNRIDVFFDTHEDALIWGVQNHEVFVEKENVK